MAWRKERSMRAGGPRMNANRLPKTAPQADAITCRLTPKTCSASQAA